MSQNLNHILDFITWLKRSVKEKEEIQTIWVYGSFARGDASEVSDIDLAFSISDFKKWSAFSREIEENAPTLRKLNMVCFEKMSQKFKDKILQEGIIIYEKRKGQTKPRKL